MTCCMRLKPSCLLINDSANTDDLNERKLPIRLSGRWKAAKKKVTSSVRNLFRRVSKSQPVAFFSRQSSLMSQGTNSSRVSCPFRNPIHLNSGGFRFTDRDPGDSFIGSSAEAFLERSISNHIPKIPQSKIAAGRHTSNGGFGVVECCKWSYHDNDVAAKSLLIENPASAEHFVQELHTAYECGAAHPGFPRVLGWRSESWGAGTLSGYIVMEKLDYCLSDYFKMITEARILRPSWGQRLKLMLDYAHALYYLHEFRRQLHGDIHVKNLMLKMNGPTIEGSVVDLGMSRSIDDNCSPYQPFQWTAPETASQGYTMASDVFSFSLAMLSIAKLESTYQEVPTEANHNLDPGLAIQLHFNDTGEICVNIPDSFGDFPSDGPPPGLKSLICTCLSTDPQARSSMQEICSTLHQLLQEVQQEPESTGAQFKTQPPELVNHTPSMTELWYLFCNKFLSLFPFPLRRFVKHVTHCTV